MYGQQITLSESQMRTPQVYNNNQYVNNIISRINLTLILDAQTHFSDKKNFSCTLSKDSISSGSILSNNLNSGVLIIDKPYDVYLESLTTFDCDDNTTKDRMGFKLTLNDFNVENYSNLMNDNSIFIPNDSNVSGITVSHKSKKLNYISTITPGRISKITGSITTINNDTIYSNANNFRMVIELILVPKIN
jgi:hypothetical protein